MVLSSDQPNRPVMYSWVRRSLGRGEHLRRGRHLHHLAQIEERHLVGAARGLLHVVGHDGDGEVVLQFVDQLLDLQRADRIERAGRLVEQDHLGPHRDGARDAQPLLLAARQAHGGGMQPVLHLVPQRAAGQRPFHALVHLRLGQLLVQLHAERDVVVDRHRKRRRLLEHHADPRAQRIQVDRRVDDVLAVHHHLAGGALAGIEVVHPVQHAQQRGLAAAGRADHAGHLAVRKIQVDALQRAVAAVEEIQVADGDARLVHARRSSRAPERRRSLPACPADSPMVVLTVISRRASRIAPGC